MRAGMRNKEFCLRGLIDTTTDHITPCSRMRARGNKVYNVLAQFNWGFWKSVGCNIYIQKAKVHSEKWKSLYSSYIRRNCWGWLSWGSGGLVKPDAARVGGCVCKVQGVMRAGGYVHV